MAIEKAQQRLTYAEALKELPETRGEFIHGEFVMTPAPHPSHQRIAGFIYNQLTNFLGQHPDLGAVYIAPVDVVLRAEPPEIVYQPDLLFISKEREDIVTNAVQGPPDLVFEVVSSSSRRNDAIEKRNTYAQFGVPEYWVVWPEEERIDVLSAIANGLYTAHQEYAPEQTLTTSQLPGFGLDVGRVFAQGRSGQ